MLAPNADPAPWRLMADSPGSTARRKNLARGPSADQNDGSARVVPGQGQIRLRETQYSGGMIRGADGQSVHRPGRSAQKQQGRAPGPLHRLAQSEHRGHQIQQRPAEVMVGDEEVPVIQAEMIDGVARNRPVGHRGSQGACHELVPVPGVAAASGVNHPAPHGAVPFDLGHFGPHGR